jgi:enoyl-CoA hydratase/carnithine racemase
MTSQLSIDRKNANLWRVTFNHPPINLIDLQTIRELSSLLGEMETDKDLKVVVFRSADPDFFLAHWDVLTDKEETARMPLGPTGLPAWPDILVRLSNAPVISIAEIRGRARGAGSEFALACDMRFASEERGILGQFEVGAGAVPGGNPMARLAGLMGRGRVLEVILGGNDFPAPLAERYGYINRALPDKEIESFVEGFSDRLASFEKYALTGAKQLINDVSLPPESSSLNALKAFRLSSQEPANRERIVQLLDRGLQTRSDIELSLGAAVAKLGRNGTLQAV